jgi:predicted site-specific integrase-resolvase
MPERRTQSDDEALIGSTESCRILNVDKTTLARWAAMGRIVPAHKLPGRNGAYLFRRGDIKDLAAQREAS